MSIRVKKYRKKQLQPMFPWFPDYDMKGVSVSDADKQNGSPKQGDMIAMNPDSPIDQWLVSEDFFRDNYEIDLLDCED